MRHGQRPARRRASHRRCRRLTGHPALGTLAGVQRRRVAPDPGSGRAGTMAGTPKPARAWNWAAGLRGRAAVGGGERAGPGGARPPPRGVRLQRLDAVAAGRGRPGAVDEPEFGLGRHGQRRGRAAGRAGPGRRRAPRGAALARRRWRAAPGNGLERRRGRAPWAPFPAAEAGGGNRSAQVAETHLGSEPASRARTGRAYRHARRARGRVQAAGYGTLASVGGCPGATPSGPREPAQP